MCQQAILSSRQGWIDVVCNACDYPSFSVSLLYPFWYDLADNFLCTLLSRWFSPQAGSPISVVSVLARHLFLCLCPHMNMCYRPNFYHPNCHTVSRDLQLFSHYQCRGEDTVATCRLWCGPKVGHLFGQEQTSWTSLNCQSFDVIQTHLTHTSCQFLANVLDYRQPTKNKQSRMGRLSDSPIARLVRCFAACYKFLPSFDTDLQIPPHSGSHDWKHGFRSGKPSILDLILQPRSFSP